MFLNGVLDTGQGTCGNLATFGWRFGWPVSLACVNSHFFCRYDDGLITHNIEATQSGHGGFSSPTDEFLIETKKLPMAAIVSGSDLRAFRPREVLGQFIGLRARHLQDVGKSERNEVKLIASETDWLLARQLCPTSRHLYKNQMVATTMRGNSLFEPHEAGHPLTYAGCLEELRMKGLLRNSRGAGLGTKRPRKRTVQTTDELFSQLEVGP